MVTLIRTLSDHSDDVNCCAFSSGYLATCSMDKTIRLYELSDFVELSYSPLRGHTYAVHCCDFSPLGNILASCSTDGTTILWNTQNGQKLAVLEHPSGSPVRVCTFSPESTYLVSGGADGTVVLWNVQSFKLHRCGTLKDGSLVACTFSPCGKVFVTGSSYGDLTVWDNNMRCLFNEKADDLGVTSCDFSPKPISDGEHGLNCFRLASCGQDISIKLWVLCCDDTTGFILKLKCILSGHTAPILSCAFSFDGQMLVSGSVDKCVIIYEANNGSILHVLPHHTRYVTACAFSPNVPLLATGSMDKTVGIWKCSQKLELKGGQEVDESKPPIQFWTEDEVSAWLYAEDLTDLVPIFKLNNIDGKELLTLTKESLTNDLHIESLGLRSKVLRKIETLKSIKCQSAGATVPDEFLCPITRELMKDPVIASGCKQYKDRHSEYQDKSSIHWPLE
ncbi:WD repeat, SAM and U-box domain-containing protein 1 isoform X2 [Ambystoma mexicanum]|uniref:WD repeat, SAM and U-box domain-containing protein 1 isoform X2 n=1 Tax=Ambystoma mexicanum TaxID=8296 RepID=UPI0037E7F072